MKDKINSLTILLIDDDSFMLQQYSAMLRQLDIGKVFTAHDGASGKALVDEKLRECDLVICDWVMPEFSGLDLLKHIRETDKIVPFLMVTGKGDKSSILSAKENGVSAYILKPFSLNELKKKIEKVVADANKV
jgi:two-component system chemotaxis response regulator CheY